MADSYAALVSQSMAHIGAEAGGAWHQLAALLRGLSLEITIEGETFGIVADPVPRVAPTPPNPTAQLQAPAHVVASVIDGHRTLDDIVLADELQVIGTLAAVVATHDALVQYVHGAIRSPSVPELRGRFDALAGVAT